MRNKRLLVIIGILLFLVGDPFPRITFDPSLREKDSAGATSLQLSSLQGQSRFYELRSVNPGTVPCSNHFLGRTDATYHAQGTFSSGSFQAENPDSFQKLSEPVSIMHRVGRLLSLMPDASAYEFLDSSGGKYLRWSPDDVPVSYKISDWWLPDAIEPVGAIYAGYKTWEDVNGSDADFNYQGTTSDTLPSDEDGVNMIAFNAEAFVAGSEGGEGVLGATYWGWYDTDTLYFDEVDIALNIDFQWTTTGVSGKFDIQGVVTHEVGHLLGLDHSDVTTATMYPSTNWTGSILSRTLDNDDEEGIRILYPDGYASTGVGGAGGGCFIATASYGSRLSSEVRLLSGFRDEFLLTNSPGRAFVKGYYRLSPAFAGFISRNVYLRKFARICITPFVKAAGVITG